MGSPFFDRPILNSPYDYPTCHWELDDTGQPTQKIIETRRNAQFVTPIPKPKKQKGVHKQSEILFDEGKGLSTEDQRYAHTAIINGVRQEVDRWRLDPDPNHWRVLSLTLFHRPIPELFRAECSRLSRTYHLGGAVSAGG